MDDWSLSGSIACTELAKELAEEDQAEDDAEVHKAHEVAEVPDDGEGKEAAASKTAALRFARTRLSLSA